MKINFGTARNPARQCPPGQFGNTKLGVPGSLENKYCYPKGNKIALASAMTEESHQRRMKGLFKAWGTKERIHRGERVVTRKTRKKIRVRMRLKLHEKVAVELREVQNIARTHASRAMQKLAEIIDDKTARDSDAISAAQVIFERAYGKATQTNINASADSNGKENEVSSTELETRIRAALARVEAITGGAPKTPVSKKPDPDIRERDRDPGSSSVH